MKHDLNNSPSYEHMMGTEKKAHEGSQSKSPMGSTNVPSKKGKKLPEKAPNGMDYSDE